MNDLKKVCCKCSFFSQSSLNFEEVLIITCLLDHIAARLKETKVQVALP